MGPPTTRHILVIGAGPAGLVALRELRRENHTVVVFERSHSIGGTWNYTPEVETDQLSTDPDRKIVHGSLYESLRVNLPRECMGFLDYPFIGGTDHRRFPGHREVLHYLERFAKDFGLVDGVRFGTEVVSVERGCDGKWVVKSRHENQAMEVEIFDAVLVCNGHHTEPRIAEIPGIDSWPGKQIHSHNYRVPDPFADQVVVLVGSSASSCDISREISRVAKRVHIGSRSECHLDFPKKQPGYANIWNHTMIERANEDGTVVFQDGNSIHVDVIMHCSGYKYHFPFLKTEGLVTVDDNRVGPLYKHVFPPSAAPGLSFIGLPSRTTPFPVCELQCKWVAGVLSERLTLPSDEEMMEDVNDFYRELESMAIPKRYTHYLTCPQNDMQREYIEWLARKCGYRLVEEWRIGMYFATTKNRVQRPNDYRDVWDDDNLVEQAKESFRRYDGSEK